MTQELHLTDDRLYVANRGAGPWSVDRYDLSNEAEWRWVPWEWNQTSPQPYPVSGLCSREDPVYGTLLAGLAHEKAMAWGQKIYGILYQETTDAIVQLAISDEIDPPGLYSTGVSVVWPEPDLVYMVTGTDGFRAYVVNPDAPSISLHTDCILQGFASDFFSSTNIANCMVYYESGSEQKLIIGSKPGLLENAPTLNIYDISYPDGIPDRIHPDRSVVVTKDVGLQCLKHKDVNHMDITPSGVIAVATSHGVGVFHVSWIADLNTLSDAAAWELIKIPEKTYLPWWELGWTSFFADVCFSDDDTLYVVKNPEGVWRIDFVLDEASTTHKSRPSAFYPGVQCGIDYNQLMLGWGNPDIETLHHPYGLVADNDLVYVHGWSGKVNLLIFDDNNAAPTIPSITGTINGKYGTEYTYSFSSTDADGDAVYYYISWGDGSSEVWIGPYSSGEEVEVTHTWEKRGSYTIEVKARDNNNGVSYWGALAVSMPRSNPSIHSFLNGLLEWVLEVFPLLKYLLGFLV